MALGNPARARAKTAGVFGLQPRPAPQPDRNAGPDPRPHRRLRRRGSRPAAAADEPPARRNGTLRRRGDQHPKLEVPVVRNSARLSVAGASPETPTLFVVGARCRRYDTP